jgi:AraC-like DNA-binding protein
MTANMRRLEQIGNARVYCHTAVNGEGRFWQAEPPEDLAPFVIAILGREGFVSRETFTVFPSAQAEIVFHFGDAFEANNHTGGLLRPMATAAMLGPRIETYEQSAGPHIDWLIVQLSPMGCWKFLGAPFGQLIAQTLDLSVFWNRYARHCFDMLSERDGFFQRYQSIVDALRAFRRGRGYGDPLLSNIAVSTRYQRRRTVDDLTQEVGLSARRIQQKFNAELGVSPKGWLKLMRVNRLLYDLHPRARGANELFIEYSDQSHAHRELKQFTGMGLGEYSALKSRGDPLVNAGARRPA